MALVLFNKPFRVLSRFTRDAPGRACLADYLELPGLRPVGRLDFDSEGLLLFTDDGRLQARLTDPAHGIEKRYLVQVEGEIGASALASLERGVRLADGPTRPARVRLLPDEPGLWPREPPIRHRAAIATRWIELYLGEGRNRQVRRMTAAVGFPTLRLVRMAIGPCELGALASGEHRRASERELAALAAMPAPLSGGRPGGRSASRSRAPARSSGADRPSSGRRGRDRRR
jgi:23S rRNA pseudouridine2457 synthase